MRKRSFFGRLLRRILLLVIAVAMLPWLLILVYAAPGVHPVSTLMIAERVRGNGYERQWVGLDQISPHLVRSVMMSEDGQFCSHYGVDLGEMRAVMRAALRGETTRGASTIAMQTAKNLFLWNDRSFIRKLLEMPLAVGADFVWSKRRMMEIYLNVAEWGPGIYGAEAAARHHFGIPASQLNARQAALLAVSLPNPIQRSASKPGRGLQRLATVIERRARNAGNYVDCLQKP